MTAVEEREGTREHRWSQRLAVPVLVAALASVPAVFLTLLDDPYSTVGTVVNWLSGAVLTAETVVLLLVAEDKRAWLRRHLWLILLTLGVLVAVVLALGPAQLLRLVRAVGALRVVRAGRIVKAARILSRRMGLTGRWTHVLSGAVGVLVASFVAVLLSDPTSSTRSFVEDWLGANPAVLVSLVVLAGALLGGATYVVLRDRGESPPPA
ncbi:hypothetical protein [Thalassiella azotivora]